MTLTTPLCIIGGGPAGLAAACEAAKFGLSSVIIEETDKIGGKVLHHDNKNTLDRNSSRTSSHMKSELDSYKENISLLNNCRVWNIDPELVVSIGKVVNLYSKQKDENELEGTGEIKADTVLIAEGALERILPTPGWISPGFMTLGAANTLVNHGILPGQKMVVAGSGPLLLLLSANIMTNGGKVAALVQCSSFKSLLQQIVPLLYGGSIYKLWLGFYTALRLIKAKVPIINNSIILGFEDQKSVNIAPINLKNYKVDQSSIQKIDVDAVACSYGLIPNMDIARMVGCWSWYDEVRGYLRVVTNHGCETSVDNVFAAGDCVLVRGYKAAEIEGRLAAVNILQRLNSISDIEYKNRVKKYRRILSKFNSFGKAMDIISKPVNSFIDILPKKTCICRCEEVSLGDIEDAHSKGAVDINDIKRRTRLGMGHCQGRFCGQVINEILNQLNQNNTAKELFTPRIPVRPVTFKDIAR